MAIYIWLVISIPAFYCFLRIRINEKQSITILAIVKAVELMLIAGTRAISVGTDTLEYSWIFNKVSNLEWKELNAYYIEIGYTIYNKLIYLFNGNFQTLLVLNSIIIVFSIIRYIKFTSKDFVMSLFLFVASGYFFSSMNIMRQYICLAFVLWAYYEIFFNNQKKKGSYLIILSCFIHSSAIVLLPWIGSYFILNNKKIKEKIFFKLLVYIGMTVATISINYLVLWLLKIGVIHSEEKLYSTGITTSVFSLNLLIKIGLSVFYLYLRRYNEDIKDDKNIDFLNYANITSCFVSVVSGIYPLFSRFNLYFSIVIIVLIPNLLSYLEAKDKRICSVLVYVVYFYMFYSSLPGNNAVPWIPFWR